MGCTEKQVRRFLQGGQPHPSTLSPLWEISIRGLISRPRTLSVKNALFRQSPPNQDKNPNETGLRIVTPTTENRTVTPRRRPNAEIRTREFLTETEIEKLIAAAKSNRWGHRDATMILVAYRHGLRVSELVDLRWDQIDFPGPFCTSAGSRAARPARIPSAATGYGRYGSCSASRNRGPVRIHV